jgi:hypothetical protein
MAEVHHLAEISIEHDDDAFADVVCLHGFPFRKSYWLLVAGCLW